MNLSVCMITCWYRDISMANYSENLINALTRRNVSVRVVTSHCACKYKYHDASSVFAGNYKLVSTPFDAFADNPNSRVESLVYRASRIPLGLRYAKQCSGSDVLHYQQSSVFSFGELPLLTLLTQTRVPHKVVTVHNLYVNRLYRPGNPLRLLPHVYRYADAIIVHTEQQKEHMVQAGIPGDKIHVVFHGSPQVTLRGLERTRVTFFGSPVEHKGFFTLLKALRILRDEGIRVNLDVYGIYGSEEEKAAKREALRNNVEDQIQWYGRLSESEFDDKMQESVLTFAVSTEPVWGSNIITRAMMNGAPVIATSIGGSQEYLADTGMYVPPNDPSALAAVISSLLDDGRLREDLERKTRQRALQYLSWDAIAEKTLQIYHSVTNT